MKQATRVAAAMAEAVGARQRLAVRRPLTYEFRLLVRGQDGQAGGGGVPTEAPLMPGGRIRPRGSPQTEPRPEGEKRKQMASPRGDAAVRCLLPPGHVPHSDPVQDEGATFKGETIPGLRLGHELLGTTAPKVQAKVQDGSTGFGRIGSSNKIHADC